MRQFAADTNVFISFFVERDEEQRGKAADLFSEASRGTLRIALPQLVLFEISYVLESQYGIFKPTIAEVLDDLVAMPGLVVIDRCPWPLIRRAWPAILKKLPDAGIAAVALANELDGIATFDDRLARHARGIGLLSYW